MAPSPVCHEPKGPDKGSEKGPEDIFRKDNQIMPNDNTNSNSKDKSNVESINIQNIGESELKSLLDEALNFRSPKDREGKSSLFQKFLKEVEESDAGKKKKIDQSRGIVDGLKATSAAIESGHHNSVGGDQNFFNNILGGCEREKKKKKNSKREGSNSNGGGGSSRRPKFSHSLKINSGSQSSVYNGNIGSSGSGSTSINVNTSNISTISNSSANLCNNSSSSSSSSSRGGSSRGSLSVRGPNATPKSATLLTSSSNIDTPMLTTQCIMTPVVAPRKQQKTELLLLPAAKASSSGDESVRNEDIELKSLNEVHSSHYTTRASLEIDGNVFKQQQIDVKNDSNGYGLSAEDGMVSCSAKTSNALMNGNAEMSSQHPIRYRAFNGALDNREDDNTSEIDEEKQQLSKKGNKKKSESSSADVVTANGTSSVDEAESTYALQKSVHNIWTTIGYPLTNAPFLILNNFDTTGNFLHSAKESLEHRKSGDEGPNYLLRDGGVSTSRLKKKKVKQKPDGNSYLSEHIEGHCGDQSIEYLLDYIEKNRSSSGSNYAAHSHSINGTVSSQKSLRVKQQMASGGGGGGVKYEKATRGKASTDEDIRHKKLPTGVTTVTKGKEHLKKSTSLEDLRHSSSSKSKSNKKQSSVDDCHYIDSKAKSPSPVSTASLPLSVKKVDVCESQALTTTTTTMVDIATVEPRLYYDSPFDDSYIDEFHLVTKKQRRKKRRSKSRTIDQKSAMTAVGGKASMSHGGFLPHNYTDRGHEGGGSSFKRSTRSTENRHRSRRKSVSSVVPSDKISDSDSIHSLPVSSTTPKCRIKKKSTSSGCTPQASYADIAKSPQCQSSVILNGDSTTTAKWQTTKTFSNVSSSSSSSTTTKAAHSSSSGADTSNNTVHSPDHSDHVELVSSSTKYEDHVELDDGCDQLLLSNNPSSNSCSGSDSPTATVNSDCNSVYKNKNLNNDVSRSNLNDSSSDNNTNNITLKCKNESIKGTVDNMDNINYDNVVSNNVNTIVNSYSQVCFNGKLGKSKDGLDPSTDNNSDDVNSSYNHNRSGSGGSNSTNNNNNNTVTTSKTKRSKSKKKTSVIEQHQESTVDGDDTNVSVETKNSNDLFIEFTLTAPSVKTKCSQTQTDLIEVNNNACGVDVTVEETVIVKNNRSIGPSATQNEGSSKLKKLSTAMANISNGSRILSLPSDGAENRNMITVRFNVDGEVLEEATAVSGNPCHEEALEEKAECSSKYNVDEVIQYVNESWNEVMKSSSSATNVQYYNAQ